MRKYPCIQCKCLAATQKKLKTHVTTVHNRMVTFDTFFWSLQGYMITSCLVWRLNVFLKMTLIWSFIITIIARILDTFLFRLNMFLKMTPILSLIIAIITGILDTFLFGLNVFLKMTLIWSLMITIITRILEVLN